MLIKNLFPRLDEQAIKQLDEFGRVLKKGVPLKGKHFEVLHKNVRALSDNLTSDREGLRKDYMTDARFLSAYLHYFLPWNLYRLSRLFTGIEPYVNDGGTIIDLGSGPLTVPMALWIALPKLRERKLTIVCVDRASKVMSEGRKLFDILTGGRSNWKIVTVKGSLGMQLREKADLVVAANTLNELNWSGRDSEQMPYKTASSLMRYLKKDGRLLLVEPGLRQASRNLVIMRAELMDQGLMPLAPCPHDALCPMHGQGTDSRWCHFNFGVEGAPEWLNDLTRRARLTKTGLSLSFVYLATAEVGYVGSVRVVSEVFKLPQGRGQYACSSRGLTLLQYPQRGYTLFPGQFIDPDWPEQSRTDLKSGAVILPVKEKLGKETSNKEKPAKTKPARNNKGTAKPKKK